jgi:ankyrin repeat protein
LEIFEDGNEEEFKELLVLPPYQLKDILVLRNKFGFCPLHITCFHGYTELSLALIKLHKDLNVSLDLYDNQNNTPLNLLSSHGYKDLNIELADMSSKEFKT